MSRVSEDAAASICLFVLRLVAFLVDVGVGQNKALLNRHEFANLILHLDEQFVAAAAAKLKLCPSLQLSSPRASLPAMPSLRFEAPLL